MNSDRFKRMFEKIIEKITTDLIEHKSISNQVCSFFGNTVFEEELISLADRIVTKSFNSTVSINEKAIVVVALTFIASSKYDGNLWDHIRDSFSLTYGSSAYNVQHIDGKIRSLVSYFKSYVKYSDEESFVAVPIVLAGVTRYWLDSFFDFCFLIYKNRLLVNVNLTDEQISAQLFDSFSSFRRKNVLDENNDYIKFGEARSYKLSKYTQSALASESNIDGIVEIGTRCIRMVINYLLEQKFDPLSFYDSAYEKWVNKINLSKKEREEINEKRKQGVWRSSITYEKGELILTTKTCWVEDSYDPKSIKIVLYNGSNILDEGTPTIVSDGMDALVIKSKRFVLRSNPLGKLKYKIFAGDEILFDSQDELYRKLVFIDGSDGTEFFSGRDFDGPALVITRTDPSSRSTVVLSNDDYYLSEFFVDSSKDYVFDGTHCGFKTVRRPGIEGKRIKWINVFSRIELKDIFVYEKINSVVFEAPLSSDSIVPILDDREVDKSNMELIELSRFANGISQYRCLIHEIESGYHTLRFEDKTNRKEIKKANFHFIVDSQAKQIISKTGLNITIEFLGTEAGYNLIKDVGFFNVLKEIKGIGACEIKFCPLITKISFDRKKWYLQNERISISDIPQGSEYLYVMSPLIKSLKSKNDVGRIEDPKLIPSDSYGWEHKTPCGYLRNQTNDDAKQRVIIIEDENGKESFYIDYVAHIDEKESLVCYDVNKKITTFKFVFSGKNQVNVCILRSGNELFRKTVNSGQVFALTGLSAFAQYDIVITEKHGIFGIEKECYRTQFYFCDKNELLDRVFEITDVDVFGPNGNSLRKLALPKITIKFLRKGKDHDLYFGTIQKLVDSDYSLQAYNSMKNIGIVKIRVEEEFEGDKMWVYIFDKDNEMLCFDHNKLTIHNSTTDEKAMSLDGIDRYLIRPEKRRKLT